MFHKHKWKLLRWTSSYDPWPDNKVIVTRIHSFCTVCGKDRCRNWRGDSSEDEVRLWCRAKGIAWKDNTTSKGASDADK